MENIKKFLRENNFELYEMEDLIEGRNNYLQIEVVKKTMENI